VISILDSAFFIYYQSGNMKSDFVSLHPYFKAHPGKVGAIKAAFPRFVEKTATEKENLFYCFTVNGDEIFCREAYESAEGLLAHLENVSAPLAEMLKVADLVRVEVHGPRGGTRKAESTAGPSESGVVYARSERGTLSDQRSVVRITT
jgi:quinol monooxygenase YgiN